MMGIILVGLLGFLAVVIATPLVLWTLCMESLNDRAATVRSAVAAPPNSCRPAFRAHSAHAARCLDVCSEPAARERDAEREGPPSLVGPWAMGLGAG